MVKKMTQILNYNIFNVLRFQIVTSKQSCIAKSLNFPFSFFETEEMGEPDIVLNIGKFTPSNKNCYIIDHKYYIKENYFYCKEVKGRARWEVEIFGFEEGKTVINFNGKFFGPELLFPNLIAQEVILMPIMIYKLSKKGYYLVHAGGVSKDGCAYIFAGRGGSSKTELIMDFVKSGFNYLGDDWVIIHKNNVLPFPKNFYSFVYSLKTGSLPTENDRILNKFCYLIRSYKNSSYNHKSFLKVEDSSMLRALFFITKASKETVIKNLNLEEATIKLVANNEMEVITNPSIIGEELGCYYNYIIAYSFVFPNSKIATFWNNFKDSIRKILRNISIYGIEMPQKYDSNLFSKINKFLQKI